MNGSLRFNMRLIMAMSAAVNLAAPPCSAAGRHPGGNACRIIRWHRIYELHLSSYARGILHDDHPPWVHGRTRHFVIHCRRSEDIAPIARRAEYGYAFVGSALDLQDAVSYHIHIFVAPIAAGLAFTNNPVLHTNMIHAVSLPGEIFVPPSSMTAPDESLFHEITHQRLNAAFDGKLPLCLEEGIAMVIGRDAAQAWYSLHGKPIRFSDQPLQADCTPLALGDLFALAAYPPDPCRLRMFFRQSMNLVAFLRRRLVPPSFGRLLEQCAAAGPAATEVICNDFGIRLDELRRAVRPSPAGASPEDAETPQDTKRK